VKRLAKGLTVSRSRGCEDIPSPNTYNGFAAVTFQFSRIGNDPGAAQLLEDLDQDQEIGNCIDVLPVEFDPQGEFPEKWFVVCHKRLFSGLTGLKRKLTHIIFIFEK